MDNARGIGNFHVSGEQQELGRVAVTLAQLLARTPDGEIQSALAAQCDINRLFIARFYDSGRIVAERSQRQFELFPEEFRAEWRKAQSEATRGSNYTPD